LAYFGMDFRKDISEPGKPPFQPTVAHYTDNYIILLSTSKAFSYAGERLGMMLVSNTLYNRRYPDLKRYFASDKFGHAMIYGALYTLTAGTGHSAQYAVTQMLKAVNNGEYNFVEQVRPYGDRAPDRFETRACRKHIDRQIEAAGPEVIIALGEFAARALLGTETSIDRLRGQFYEYGDVAVMPTHEPAYLLANASAKRAVWEDMKLVMQRVRI